MASQKAKGLKSKEAKCLIANFQYPKATRCAAVKKLLAATDVFRADSFDIPLVWFPSCHP